MSISCLWLETRLNNSSHRQHLDVFCIKSRDVRNFRVPHLSGLHFVAVCLTAEYTNDKWIQMDSVACRIKTVQLQSTRSLSAFKICFRSFDEAFATVQSMEVGKWYKIPTAHESTQDGLCQHGSLATVYNASDYWRSCPDGLVERVKINKMTEMTQPCKHRERQLRDKAHGKQLEWTEWSCMSEEQNQACSSMLWFIELHTVNLDVLRVSWGSCLLMFFTGPLGARWKNNQQFRNQFCSWYWFILTGLLFATQWRLGHVGHRRAPEMCTFRSSWVEVVVCFRSDSPTVLIIY